MNWAISVAGTKQEVEQAVTSDDALVPHNLAVDKTKVYQTTAPGPDREAALLAAHTAATAAHVAAVKESKQYQAAKAFVLSMLADVVCEKCGVSVRRDGCNMTVSVSEYPDE
jgi:hypothetical protein